MKNTFKLLICLFALSNLGIQPLLAQKENLDRIAAIVGDKIILKSEIEAGFADYKRENPDADDSLKCKLLEDYLSQKILVEQADRDSIIVSDEEIEGSLENRIRYFVSMYGSEEKLEEMAGKTVYQLKDDYRPLFKDQLTAQRMQQTIMSNVKITPQEVKVFYDKIPTDSLPFYPSMVEVGQIVFKPDINKEVEDYAIKKLEGIREEIVSGKSSFDIMAGVYSEDPGSKDNGGDLGIQGRDDYVPEFSAAAFKLQNGEISNIVKTKFGFHIIQMVNRQGEKAKLRHILIKPLITNDMVRVATKKADSVRANLVSGKMLFSEAVGKYTFDDFTKNTGGMFANPQTAGTLIQIEDLEPSVALTINDLKVGEFSQPISYTDQNSGDKLVRIIYLKNRTEPHKANLNDDYNKIQQVAFAEKQNDYLFKWINDRISTFYIMIDDEYQTCSNIAKWNSSVTKKEISFFKLYSTNANSIMYTSDVEAAQGLQKKFKELKDAIAQIIVGQDEVVESVIISILCNGHSLLVGVPGLAKTLLVNTIARVLDLDFKRIQFTPDLMPSDIMGAEILDEHRNFKFIKGPLFSNIILADEINRTPPKTQAALLEAMQERHVTIGGQLHILPAPFFVLATQNPIEQEGTYPLPEAQLDRFMFNIWLDYPSFQEELSVVKNTTSDKKVNLPKVMSGEDILYFQQLVRKVPVPDNVLEYAVSLVHKTRPNDQGSDTARNYISWGAGPRASQNLILGAKCYALLHGKYSPDIEDVKAVAIPILRHRVVLNYKAEADGLKVEGIIKQLM